MSLLLLFPSSGGGGGGTPTPRRAIGGVYGFGPYGVACYGEVIPCASEEADELGGLYGFGPYAVACYGEVIPALGGSAPVSTGTHARRKKLRWREWKPFEPVPPDVRIVDGELVRRVVEPPVQQVEVPDLAPYFKTYDALTRRVLERVRADEEAVIALIVALDD